MVDKSIHSGLSNRDVLLNRAGHSHWGQINWPTRGRKEETVDIFDQALAIYLSCSGLWVFKYIIQFGVPGKNVELHEYWEREKTLITYLPYAITDGSSSETIITVYERDLVDFWEECKFFIGQV